jgi:hypothetical protein
MLKPVNSSAPERRMKGKKILFAAVTEKQIP